MLTVVFNKMIEIQRTIEEEVKLRSPYKTIFKGTKFRLKVFMPLYIIGTLLLVPYFWIENIGLSDSFRMPYLLLIGIFAIAYFFIFINPYAKKQLEKKGVISDKGFFKHWANNNYLEYKYSSFRKRLVELNILTNTNPILNSKLLKEYSEFYKSESERIKDFEIFKIIGSLFLVFIVPIWNQFLGKLFKLSKPDEIIDVFKISSQFLVLIFVIIIALIYVRYMLKELIENRKRRLLQISYELLNLKWNEDLKTKHNNGYN